MRPVRLLLAVLTSGAIVSAPFATTAQATFPGANGFIAFQGGGFGGPGRCPDIHFVDPANAGNVQTMTNCPQFVGDPRWSADASTIVVTWADNNNVTHIGTISTSAGTGAIASVSTSGVSSPRDPSFNKDATVIAFGGGNAGGSDTHDVFTVPTAGGTPTNLTNAGPGGVNKEPVFSPDGTKLAWVTKVGPVYDIVVANANGSSPVDVTQTDNTHNDQWPSWSPDSMKIAFASDRSGTYAIYQMKADGSSVVQLTNDGSTPDIQPTWSPDGNQIAYTRGCTDDQCNSYSQNGDIYRIDMSGGTAPFTGTPVVNTAGPESDPDWGVACPNCKGGGTPQPPGPEKRAVTLLLKGQLTAYGVLKDTGGQIPPCAFGQPVSVQKKSGSSWKTLKTVRSGSTGKYSTTIPNKPGTYRAYAAHVKIKFGDCAAATSKPVKKT